MSDSNSFQYPDVLFSFISNKSSPLKNNMNVFGFDTPNASRQSHSSKILERDNSDAGNQPVVCKWENCLTVFMNCELLHKHVGETHALRQKSDDFEYSCKWGACNKATFKKREHLLSHLMVHIPLKRFKCVTCQKKFKRSHDLKKHLKIHLRDNDDWSNNLSSTGSLSSVGSRTSSLIHDQYSQHKFNTQLNFDENSLFNKEDKNFHSLKNANEHQNILYKPPKDIVEELFSQFQNLKTKYYETLQDIPNELPHYPLVFQKHQTNGIGMQNQVDNSKVTNKLNEQDLQQRYQYTQYSILDTHNTMSTCEMLDKKDRYSNDQQANNDVEAEHKINTIVEFIKCNILTNDTIISKSELSKQDLLNITDKYKHSIPSFQVLLQYLTLCL